MKRILFQVLALISLTSTTFAGSVSLGLVNMNMDYREYDDNGQILDSEKSQSIIGIEAAFDFDFMCSGDGCQNIEFRASKFEGDTEYLGSYIGSGQPYGSVKSTTSNSIYDLSLDYTYNTQVWGFGVKYGAGIGYHSWMRELSATQTELYHWVYATPVLGLSRDLFDNWNVAAVVKYKYGLMPTMKANDLHEEFQLGSANTLEVNVPITYSYNRNLDFYTAYVYTRQTIEKSNLITQDGYIWWEPDSTENNNYIKFGLTYHF